MLSSERVLDAYLLDFLDEIIGRIKEKTYIFCNYSTKNLRDSISARVSKSKEPRPSGPGFAFAP